VRWPVIGQAWSSRDENQIELDERIRKSRRHGKLHPVGACHSAGFASDKRHLIALMLGEICIRFREYIEWACNVQCLHTIEYDNGDFHAVTFIK
jgi:hypothetical protein